MLSPNLKMAFISKRCSCCCTALQPTQTHVGRAVTHIDHACSHNVYRLSRGINTLGLSSMVKGHVGQGMGVGSGHIKMTSPLVVQV